MQQYETKSFGEKIHSLKKTFTIEIYFTASYFGTLDVGGLSQVSRVGNNKKQNKNKAKQVSKSRISIMMHLGKAVLFSFLLILLKNGPFLYLQFPAYWFL